MPLHRVEDFYPNYKETFGGDDIRGMHLYTESGNKVGTVTDALVDPDGKFRYLVIKTDFDANKHILLPIGLSRSDYNSNRVYVDGLSKEQVQNLPEYKDNMTVDYDYEERVRKAYRPVTSTTATTAYNRDTYTYDQDASLYDLNQRNAQSLKLYEERLVASKQRVKAGEVSVGKHIETETARVSVPIEKERVVIERVTPTETTVNPSDLQFQEGEVARVEVYEEKPDIHKEAFVREEVKVKKVVEQDTVEAQETVRREELDIDTQGDLRVNDKNRNV